MLISLDNALGIHAKALSVYSQRSSVLAANLANADTPNFKARDIDFKHVLDRAAAGKSNPGQLQATRPGHIGAGSGAFKAEQLFREPHQPSLDGNTVDVQVEQAAFADNSLRYMATIRFISGRVNGLMSAIKGE